MASSRRLAAILAADLFGYSRLMDEDEEGTLRRLKRVQAEVLDPRFVEYGGRLVKTTGDGFLVEFSSVIEALRCASAIQADMATRLDPDPRRQLLFRIGIHQGDIVVEDNDIFGNGVNIAARLEGIAEPGGISISARVQEDAFGRIELEFEDIGDQQLKNIARPVRVFRVHAPGPARATADSTPAEIPVAQAIPDGELEPPSASAVEDLLLADGLVETEEAAEPAAPIAVAAGSALAELAATRLGCPVEVIEAAGGWQPLEPERRTVLPVGGRNPGTRNQLGGDATLGLRVWDARPRVVLRVGPLDRTSFDKLLTDQRAIGDLAALALGCLGADAQIVVKPVLAGAARGPLQLDTGPATAPRLGPRLGRNAWVSHPLGRDAPDADDVVLIADVPALAPDRQPAPARLTAAK